MKKNTSSSTAGMLADLFSTGGSSENVFFVIQNKGEPRWIVPGNSKAGFPVLNTWRPYGILSFAAWKVLLVLYRLNALSFVPGIEMIRPVYRDRPWFKNAGNGGFIPVIYIGTPGKARKAVITLVNDTDYTPVSVVKVPIGPRAGDAVLRETRILQKICGTSGLEAPEIIFFDPNEKVAIQMAVGGRHGSGKFSEMHLDILLTLSGNGKPKKEVSLSDLGRNMSEVIRVTSMKDDKRRMLMEHALSLKNEHTFSTALVHGDFAPWNIKMIASGRSILVDWEDAETEGAPLYDICHFFLIQSFLFKTRWSLQGMLENRHVKKYIKLLGIDLETAGQLATYYHIHRILSLMGKNEMEGYGEYLFDNLISRRVP